MYILSVNSSMHRMGHQSFKSVSIKPDYINSINVGPNTMLEECSDRISERTTESILNKLQSILKEEELVKLEMKTRREVEREKKWYQSVDFHKIDVLENNKYNELNKQRKELVDILIKISNESEKIVSDTVEDLKKYLDNQALLKSKLKSISEFYDTDAELMQNKGFNCIAGYNKEKNILYKYFINEIQKEQYGEISNVPNAILFFGPTGNGKTTFAKAFADETKCNLVSLTIDPFCEKQVADEKFYNELIDVAQKAEKNFLKSKNRTIIFLDEIINVIDKESTILPLITKFIQECSNEYHCTIFATTNHPLKIAMPLEDINEKFPYIVALDPPDVYNKAKVLEYYITPKINTKLDFVKLATFIEQRENVLQERFSISQIKEAICKKITNKEFSENEFFDLLSKIKPNITKDSLIKYEKEIKLLMKNRVI